jgi:predicted nucleic acid-binding protein
LTEPLFFDTDCLSAFLWVNDQSLLSQLYQGRIVIPQAVYTELSNPKITHLKARVDALLSDHSAKVESIEMNTPEYELYRKLTSKPDPGHVIIGNGEAAAIAMAKEKGGILASNNLRDVAAYVKEFDIQHITTGAILKEALKKGLITEDIGNQLWQDMLRKRRKLGYPSFSDYLKETNGQ